MLALLAEAGTAHGKGMAGFHQRSHLSFVPCMSGGLSVSGLLRHAGTHLLPLDVSLIPSDKDKRAMQKFTGCHS